MRRRLIIGALLLVSTTTAAEPIPEAGNFVHLHSPRVACLMPGMTDCAQLQPGWFMGEEAYLKLNDNLKLLQDSKTRLTAENKSLRQAVQTWQPGWMALLGSFASGIAIAVYVESKVH
jgi:hypothetical protein